MAKWIVRLMDFKWMVECFIFFYVGGSAKKAFIHSKYTQILALVVGFILSPFFNSICV